MTIPSRPTLVRALGRRDLTAFAVNRVIGGGIFGIPAVLYLAVGPWSVGAILLAGIVVLKSPGMARFMNANVSGVNVPDQLIDRLKKSKEKTKSGETAVEIAVELINDMKGICQGVHIMPLGWDHLVPEIIQRAGLA